MCSFRNSITRSLGVNKGCVNIVDTVYKGRHHFSFCDFAKFKSTFCDLKLEVTNCDFKLEVPIWHSKLFDEVYIL